MMQPRHAVLVAILTLAPAWVQAGPPWEQVPDPLRADAPDGSRFVAERRVLRHEAVGGTAAWRSSLPEDALRVALTTGGDVVVLGSAHLLRVGPNGQRRWDALYQGRHPCGYPAGMALGYRD